jgi:hypothetical protein
MNIHRSNFIDSDISFNWVYILRKYVLEKNIYTVVSRVIYILQLYGAMNTFLDQWEVRFEFQIKCGLLQTDRSRHYLTV